MSPAGSIASLAPPRHPPPAADPRLPSPPADAAAAPTVLIVLLNWNSAPATIACVHSLLRTHYPHFSILIIDNGSADDSPTRLRALTSDRVRLIELPTNTGFTGGCNLGFQIALERRDDFVWLLNNDTLTSPDTLASLIRLAETDPRIGLLSPRITSLEHPEKDLNLGGLFRPEVPTFQSTRLLERAREWATTDPSHVLLMGTALLVRTDLLRRIGLFDDALFAYWEDTDFSLRAIQAGFRNVVDFNSSVLHHEKDAAAHASSLPPHYWYYMARNECRFWRKHARGLARLKAIWWTYISNLGNLARLPGNQLSSAAVIAGLWDGWRGRSGPFSPSRRAPALVAHAIHAHARLRFRTTGPA